MRGIVASDVFRRLVARSMAQQFGPAIERVTSPFQYALSTRAGTECLAHAIQVLTDLDHTATVVSIDGIRAFDDVSRQAMLESLLIVEGAIQRCLSCSNSTGLHLRTCGKMKKESCS